MHPQTITSHTDNASVLVTSMAVLMLNTMIIRGVPSKSSALVILDTTGECPSDDRRQEYRNVLRYATREILETLLPMQCH